MRKSLKKEIDLMLCKKYSKIIDYIDDKIIRANKEVNNFKVDYATDIDSLKRSIRQLECDHKNVEYVALSAYFLIKKCNKCGKYIEVIDKKQYLLEKSESLSNELKDVESKLKSLED